MKAFPSRMIFGLALAATPFLAMAQVPTPVPPPVFGGYAPLAVTSAHGHVALPTTAIPFAAITVSNYGAQDVFFVLGDTTAAATTSSEPIRSGGSVCQYVGAATFLDAITSTSTSTLDIYQATGCIPVVKSK